MVIAGGTIYFLYRALRHHPIVTAITAVMWLGICNLFATMGADLQHETVRLVVLGVFFVLGIAAVVAVVEETAKQQRN